MKRLWKKISPCLSDIQGFQEIVKDTSSLGIVDDSSNYKPIKKDGSSHGRFHHEMYFVDTRILSSKIKETDVINGTREKVIKAFTTGKNEFDFSYVLLTSSPCAAMINTDLDEIGEEIEKKYSLPVAVVPLNGEKDYLYGISCTLEKMGHILLSEREKISNSVNILGCNAIDWSLKDIDELELWLNEQGIRVLSKWGVKELEDNLRLASMASLNLVVNISGLRLAKFMEEKFKIPYIVVAPFGKVNCDIIMNRIKGNEIDNSKVIVDNNVEVLIIGEQVEANALRNVLRDSYKSIKVCSFFEMDKEVMESGDKKLVSEDELKKELENPNLKLVLGDVDLNIIDRDINWIPLANVMRISPSTMIYPISKFGDKIDNLLCDGSDVN